MNEASETDEATKDCPHCGETIRIAARKCRYCHEYLDEDYARERRRRRRSSRDRYDAARAERLLLPVGRPASAIAAGYCGLLAPMPIFPFGIAGVVCGIIALRTLKDNPEMSGRGRAIFGIVMGVLFTVIYTIFYTVALVEHL